MMLEAYGALKKERAPLSGEDIFNLSVLRYVNARGFAQICLDEYPSLAVSDSDVISNLLSKRRSAQPVQLFAHGLNRLSILRQVLQNLRYPWPGRVATENASALIKSFWWRPPFGSDRITVFVTPDNPTLLHSLNAEFSEPFQTEWGQKLSVSFEPFHSRD